MSRHSKIFTLLLLLLTASSRLLTAQVNYFGNEIAVGVKGGTAMTFVTFSPSVEQTMNWGYHGGVVFRYSGEKNLALQLEANFVQKGWKESSGEFGRTLSYVDIPVLSHFFFGKGVFRWIVNLGPQVSFMVLDQSHGNPSLPQHTEPIKNRFDYGLCGGTGFEINTRCGGIYQLEARFAFSFADFFDNRYSAPFQQSSSMTLLLGGAVLFNCK